MSTFSTIAQDWLLSLPNSELTKVLSSMQKPNASQLVNRILTSPSDGKKTELMKRREERAAECEIKLREPANPQRRERCLRDPELYLKTYFGRIFRNEFASHHKEMIRAIYDRAFTGGDKAIAAPRGDGKSQVAIGMTTYCFHATPINFPVIIAQTSPKARKMYAQIRNKYENQAKYTEFHEDFPEVTMAVAGLRGAPQRAAFQWYWYRNEQRLIGLQWRQDGLVMPSIDCEWGNLASGNRLVYFGLDGAIRGEGFEEMRPDLAIIDDPETREIAFSPTNRHEDIEEMIDGDVAGLSGPDRVIARVVLTTIQNASCYSARVTDPKKKPSFEGERYGWLQEYPEHMDLWDNYVAMRHKDKYEGHRHAPNATAYYLANKAQMSLGAIVTNTARYIAEKDEDGNVIEHDALQAFFNRVADYGWDRVLAEYQNDPKEDEKPEELGINEGMVCSRMSGLVHNEKPAGMTKCTLGVDVGKYKLDYVLIGFHGNAVGTVLDYGEQAVRDTNKESSDENILRAIYRALHELRIKLVATHSIDLAFIDSGYYPQAAYSFVKQVGLPWHVSKGHDTESMRFVGENTNAQQFFEQVRADRDFTNNVILWNVNSSYWKEQVHQRFTTLTRSESGLYNDGSLSLWSSDDLKTHAAFARQIVSERLVYKEGKKKWEVKSRDNHKLDATALALAAAACLGVRVIPRQQPTPTQPQPKTQSKPSNRFRQRPGGWVPRR